MRQTLFVLGVVLTVVGFFVMFNLQEEANICRGFLGLFLQGCGGAETLYSEGEIVASIGIIAGILGFFLEDKDKTMMADLGEKRLTARRPDLKRKESNMEFAIRTGRENYTDEEGEPAP